MLPGVLLHFLLNTCIYIFIGKSTLKLLHLSKDLFKCKFGLHNYYETAMYQAVSTIREPLLVRRLKLPYINNYS